jgi:hypothetical protein
MHLPTFWCDGESSFCIVKFGENWGTKHGLSCKPVTSIYGMDPEARANQQSPPAWWAHRVGRRYWESQHTPYTPYEGRPSTARADCPISFSRDPLFACFRPGHWSRRPCCRFPLRRATPIPSFNCSTRLADHPNSNYISVCVNVIFDKINRNYPLTNIDAGIPHVCLRPGRLRYACISHMAPTN